MKPVLISIKPHWADLILRGEKVAELRKSCPAPQPGNVPSMPHLRSAYICHGGHVVGRVDVLDIITCADRPQATHEVLADMARVTREQWAAYAPRYVWMVGNPERYISPVPLSAIGISRAPQAWQYLTTEQAEKLERIP